MKWFILVADKKMFLFNVINLKKYDMAIVSCSMQLLKGTLDIIIKMDVSYKIQLIKIIWSNIKQVIKIIYKAQMSKSYILSPLSDGLSI